jgi:hypothetical protein
MNRVYQAGRGQRRSCCGIIARKALGFSLGTPTGCRKVGAHDPSQDKTPARTAAHFAPILQSNEKAGALSRLCSRPMKKSRCGGSLDGVDFKVYQRRASYPPTGVDKQGWYTGAKWGRVPCSAAH